MNNESQNTDGIALTTCKTFYSKARKTTSKKDETKSAEPSKARSEDVSAARGKRRRIQCSRYNGFVVDAPSVPVHRFTSPTQRPKAVEYIRGSAPCPKSKKKTNANDSLELEEAKFDRNRITKTLTLPIEPPTFERAYGKANKNRTPERSAEIKNKGSPSNQAPLNSQKVVDKSENSGKSDTKFKRKHALCSIFDDIWGSKQSIVTEKPDANGIGSQFSGAFDRKAVFKSETDRNEPKPDNSNVPLICPETDYFTISGVGETCEIDENVPELLPPEPDDILLSHEVVISSDPFSFPGSPPKHLRRPNIGKSWLHSVQTQCSARSKQITPQLFIRKVNVLLESRPVEHRKRRKRRWSRRKQRRRNVDDADDEHSGDGEGKSGHSLTGPLNQVLPEDLWILKTFYLRYLCNYYHLNSDGCKGLLVSRLHQFILKSRGNSSLSIRRIFKLRMSPQERGSPVLSWVKLAVRRKEGTDEG